MRAPRHPNPRLAKIHQLYTVSEAARLFGKHPRTILGWVKAGLQTVDKRRPFLIRGRDLKAFLEMRRVSSRQPCPPGTIFCFSCREPRRPAGGMADFEPRDHGAGNLMALCEACGGLMRRRANPDQFRVILPGIEVRVIAGGAPHSGAG